MFMCFFGKYGSKEKTYRLMNYMKLYLNFMYRFGDNLYAVLILR